jgi:adenylate cyclase
MSTQGTYFRNQQRTKQLQFDRYILDLNRGCLLLDGNEIALRPKTFAVLRYLVENSGHLVSKDELFAAVWPNLAVTDDTLIQSISELRRGLEDEAARLIKTIPRRGYRLDAEVVDANGPASVVLRSDASHRVVSPTAITVFTPRRTGIYLSIALAVLATAGLLWTGASKWQLSSVKENGHQPTIKRSEITKPAVAVLPLFFRADNTTREYFADGLTQDIINALGRFSALTVMSWNAVLPFKGKPANPEETGRALSAGYLVEGAVQQDADRVRVTAQLVDTRSGHVLWSGRFDESLQDVFALQDAITTQIVRALAVRVTQIEQRRVFAKPTESLEAYDYVLRARPAAQRPTRANNVEARALLRRAIELDTNYAAAYAAFADTYYIATAMGWAESPNAFLGRAEELATKALSLDASDVRARVIVSRIHVLHQRYREAEEEIERAIAINPNDAQSLAGRGNILMWLGQTDAAIEALEQALRIDPSLSPIDRFALSFAYYLKGHYDRAADLAERNLRETPGAHFSRVLLAAAYAQQDRPEDAGRVGEAIRRLDPTFDSQTFGSKFLNMRDLEHLREGLRKAHLYPPAGSPQSK